MVLQRTSVLTLLLSTCCPPAALAQASQPPGPVHVTPAGKDLARLLDTFDVENHWLAGRHIADWKTGAADSKSGGPRTHCSLFVAAVCAKRDVPFLDSSPQMFLSNRQQDWLLKEGKQKGWTRVADPVAAQWLANRGALVLASYKNTNPKKAGHIAVVRPADVTAGEVRTHGPRIIQAGVKNYRETDVKTGFKHHPGAWDKGEILYFAYQLKKETP